MELKEFIKEALCQISEGVKEAQEECKKHGAFVSPSEVKLKELSTATFNGKSYLLQLVSFEVGLTDSSNENNKKGIGVFFGGFSAGTGKENASGYTSVTRVNFSVPIILPSLDNANKIHTPPVVTY